MKRPDAANMIIEVSSSMISGNGGVAQPIAYATGLTFASAMTQRQAGFLRGRKGSKCR